MGIRRPKNPLVTAQNIFFPVNWQSPWYNILHSTLGPNEGYTINAEHVVSCSHSSYEPE